MFGKRSGSDTDTKGREARRCAGTSFRRRGFARQRACGVLAAARAGKDGAAGAFDRGAALRHLLSGQGDDLRRADRGDRSRAARQARRRIRARGNPRHRQRDHRDQEHRDVDRRAGGTARRHLQRRARLRPARAAAVARRYLRHHGQRRRHGLHRSRRPHPAHRHPLPRQPAAVEHLPAHRQPGRPARRRILADLRRPSRRRLARQRHRPAAGDRRPRAHHPQIQEGQADPRPAGQIRRDHAGGRDHPADHRTLSAQRADLRRHRLRQDHAA